MEFEQQTTDSQPRILTTRQSRDYKYVLDHLGTTTY